MEGGGSSHTAGNVTKWDEMRYFRSIAFFAGKGTSGTLSVFTRENVDQSHGKGVVLELEHFCKLPAVPMS